MGNNSSQPRNLPDQPQYPPFFPPELIFLVLEAAYCHPDIPYTERCVGLRAAALVSLAWLCPAQQLLWRSINIQSTSQLRALLVICDMEEALSRGMILAGHTRTLSATNRSCHGSHITMYDIARLLKRLRRVEKLQLSCLPADLPLNASFTLQLAVTRRPDVPKLTTLRVSFTRISLVHELLRILPSLRFVEASMCVPDAGERDKPSPGPGPYCKLYELRWGANSNAHAAHVLRSSVGTLRILALHTLPPNFPALMVTYGPRLRSLRVFRYEPDLPLAIRHCTVLEEFTMQDHIPPAELLAELPSTLQHLAIDCDAMHQRHRLEAVVAWIRGTKGALRVLTCFSPDESNPHWLDLVRTCQQCNVELRCFKGWCGLYNGMDEELGEVVRFPRAVPHHAERLLDPTAAW